MVNALKSQTLSVLKENIGYQNAGIHRMLVRIANRKDTDQTVSDEAV